MREGMRRTICTVYVEPSEDRLCYGKHNGIAEGKGKGKVNSKVKVKVKVKVKGTSKGKFVPVIY
jgi:hypothetical protein